MPFKSKTQRRFFQLCKEAPEKAQKKCPPKEVIEEYLKESGSEESSQKESQ